MKKSILLLFSLFTFGIAFSQNTFPTGANTNVGIGTGATAPTTRLQLTSATAGTSGFRITNLTSTTATTAGLLGKAMSVDANGNVVLVPVVNTNLFTADGALASARTVNMSTFNLTFNPSTASSQFFINGTTGNVGVGTITPATKLEVKSTTAGTSGVRLTNLLSTSPTVASNGKALSVDATGNVILVPVTGGVASGIDSNTSLTAARTVTMANNNFIFKPTNNADFLINGANGKVGIGVPNPLGLLHIGDATGSGVVLNNRISSVVSQIPAQLAWGESTIGTAGDLIVSPRTDISSSVRFFTNNGTNINERFRILGNGNVGIGTDAPSAKLEVKSGVTDNSGLKLTNLLSTSPSASTTLNPTAVNGKALSVDATGNVVLVPVLNTATAASTNSIFIPGYPDGYTFVNEPEEIDKCYLLSVGGGTDKTKGTFRFEDYILNTFTPQGPVSKLTLSDRTNKIRFQHYLKGNGYSHFILNDKNANNYFKVDEDGNDNFTMTMPKPNSKVGIGTETPTATLDVIGNVKANQAIFSTSQPDGSTFASARDRNDKCIALALGKSIGTGIGYENTRMFNFWDFPQSNIDAKSSVFFGIEDRNDQGRFRMSAETGGATNFQVLNKLQQDIFKVSEDGNDNVFFQLPKPNSSMGIGTDKFTDGTETYRLSVNGSVRATKVKVYTTWADYVFNKEYNLRSLQELEAFIEQNGHLPNVPSAQEVAQKGLDLGDMSRIQQEKIEELTLYLIQQNKEIQELKAQMKALLEKK
jgi:hypothetical protein